MGHSLPRSGRITPADSQVRRGSVSILANTANGKVVHVSGPGRVHPQWSDQPGRHHHFRRYPHRDGPAGYTSHSNTLVQDGGFFSIVTTTDSRGNVLSEQVIQHGPHPFGSDFTVLCDVIASAIG